MFVSRSARASLLSALIGGCLALGCGDNKLLAPGSCAEGVRFGDSSVGEQPSDALLQDRLACSFDVGATTAESLGADAPSAAAVSHVIVVMLENRSFDHYLSDLPAARVTDADVAEPDVSNPTDHGTEERRFVPDTYCIGNHISHEWASAHLQLNNGQLNGFVAASGKDAMAYYEQRDLPVLYGLASQFALSDRYFSSLLGPTWPNRMFLFAGTSCGYAEGSDTNPNITLKCGLKRDNIVKQLQTHGQSYKFYDQSGPASVAVGLGITGVPASIAQFVKDANDDALPAVSFVGANTGTLPSVLVGAPNDDHPAANVLLGEQFIYDVVQTLVASPAWKSSVLFITYDEHGGFYDHVRPPRACPPTPGEVLQDHPFDQYGFRVPFIVVSPFARRRFVSHADADHTSIVRFIQHWQHLPALTGRDANAWPLLDMFDFEHPDLTSPDLGARPSPTSCGRGP
jgi:phospholipase C